MTLVGRVAQWITRLTTDQEIPGSNPGMLGIFSRRQKVKDIKFSGNARYRSQYLSHAKRALFHMSYIPICMHVYYR